MPVDLLHADRRSSTRATVAAATAALALFVGALDLALGSYALRGTRVALSTFVIDALASASVAAALFGLVGASAAVVLRHRPRLRASVTTGTFAAIVAAPVCLIVPHTLGRVAETVWLSRVALDSAGIGALVALFHAFRRPSSRPPGGLRLASVACAWLAVAAVLLFASGWFEAGLANQARPILVLAATAAITWLFVRHAEPVRARSALLVASAWVATLPVVWLAAARDESSRTWQPSGPPGAASAARGVHRILLVVVDTLRADHLSWFAPGAAPTPNADALASDALVFDAARSSAPWTLPSMTSILTGVRPDAHQVLSVHARPSARLPYLAESLRAAGYRTGAIGTNVALRPEAGLDRGFDDYEFFPRQRGATPLGSRLTRRHDGPRQGDAAHLTELALDWMGAHEDEDFFLWLHYYDPHFPYQSPETPAGSPVAREAARYLPREVRAGLQIHTSGQRELVRDAYAAEVAYFDRHFGRVLAFLRERGWYDDTVIVLTADHGEEFWDHGSVEHGQSVYDELLRVPLAIKPAGPPRPSRVAHCVSTVALAPTVLALAGLDPAQRGFAEPPLLLQVAGEWRPAPPRPTLSTGTMFYENRVALAFEGFKYVRHEVSGREELFDLATDPAEAHPLAVGSVKTLDRAHQLLAELEAQAAAQRQQLDIRQLEAADIGEGVLRDLRALGYVK